MMRDNYYENEKPGNRNILKKDNMFINQDKHNYYFSAAFSKLFADEWYFKAGYIGRIKRMKLTGRRQNDIGLDDNNWTPLQIKHTIILSTGIPICCTPRSTDTGGYFSARSRSAGGSQCTEIQNTKSNTRFHVYPRVKFSLQTGNAGSLSLSYLQRVIRPNGADLSPFTNYSDPTHLSQEIRI